MSKTTLLSSAALLALLASAPGGAAAQSAPPPQAPGTDEQVVVVTGSRIARDPNATAPLPVTVLSADELRAAGAADVSATLRTIPALISSGTVADSIERGAGGIGQATLNLRQLGANRTLVLVDGNRHVSGVAGSQTVDVSTIPPGLIERVDVLTGGASAVFGADAVTGVVNYVLSKRFEGVRISGQAGVSGESDGQTYTVDGTYGRSFLDDRLNLVVSAGYTNEDEILFSERDFTANNGRANNSTTYEHPDRRFQIGQINAATMPNFASRFRVGGPGPRATRIAFGAAIPTREQFATLFPGQTPTAAEAALMDRAAAAPRFIIAQQPVFAISSNASLIFRADFGFFTTDINNNGIRDCNESFTGWTGFGGGGCYVTDASGAVRIFQDGIISTAQNQFGGDGAVERTNETSLIPGSERTYLNLRSFYDLGDDVEVYFDAKYTKNTATSRSSYNTFYDTLLIAADNPFIPAVLQAEAVAAGGLRISRDFTDLGPAITTGDRETYRFVAGLSGRVSDHLSYEVVANFGQTENAVTFSNSVLYDRLFAAIDVVRGPNGQPICRSNISNVPHPGSETFPLIAPGFFTFRPGDGQCVPVNLFRGVNSVSAAGVAFITRPTTNIFKLEQRVFTATLAGDTTPLWSLPGGPVRFVLGAEYRQEQSDSQFSKERLGLLPANSPAGPEGTFIGSISRNQSLLFDPTTRTLNTGGGFDVREVFAEVSLPVLSGVPFADELTVDAAVRYAEYSTVGEALTWNISGIWAPIQDLRLRSSYSQAIRAPNISELFDPAQGATFRPADPCSVVNQTATPQRRANCIAAATALGIPNAATFIAGYSDPLTGRFSGTSGGNPDLEEETAETYTVGFVVQPRFVSGLTLSADYYSISIEDAIAAVTAQNIVNACYDSTTFPNQYCSLFSRNGPSAGPATFGFNFLRQTQLNFGRIETSGADFTISYRFSLFEDVNVTARLNGNWTEKVDRFFDPRDPTVVDPALGELGVPEWSGIANIGVSYKRLRAGYSVQYIESTAKASAIQIERILTEFGPDGFAPDYFIHGLNFEFEWNDTLSLYGGVNNLTDEEPYIASSAYPVSGIGRYMFLGFRSRF